MDGTASTIEEGRECIGAPILLTIRVLPSVGASGRVVVGPEPTLRSVVGAGPPEGSARRCTAGTANGGGAATTGAAMDGVGIARAGIDRAGRAGIDEGDRSGEAAADPRGADDPSGVADGSELDTRGADDPTGVADGAELDTAAARDEPGTERAGPPALGEAGRRWALPHARIGTASAASTGCGACANVSGPAPSPSR